MPSRSKPSTSSRTLSDRPTTISLNRQSLAEWYAAYKARKAFADTPQAPAPVKSAGTTSARSE
jgi:hypothetical protein